MSQLLEDASVIQRVLDHIDHKTTDVSVGCWREPVANYCSEARLGLELQGVFRTTATPFCPSAALSEAGSYLARAAAGVPLLAVRGRDGVVRAFLNTCRHRGAQVAAGSGQVKAFVCPYHAWTYDLDGALRGVPHDYGFPNLEKACRGLVAVDAEERGGLIFVTQAPTPARPASLDVLPEMLSGEMRLVSATEQITEANWKIVTEGFLEGYHIYATHRETFFPAQFDNLNVVERFGRNSRVTFPYRNIQKYRGAAEARRDAAGVLTYVYHLFPNAIIATFPQRTIVAVLEPEGLARTRTVTYELARRATLESDRPAVEHDADFVNAGAREDRAVVESIQRGLASGANETFEFGRFEGAIAHFHRNLHDLIGD